MTGLLLLAACGGPGGPTGTIALELGVPSVELPLGGDAAVTVTLARSGQATGSVVLDSTGAPEWVTVSFEPTVLTGTTLESTMKVATDGGHPDAAPTSFTITVTASGAGLTAEDTLAVEVTLTDVAGVLVDAFGEPMPGHTVLLDDRDPVVTAGDGSFEFTDVSVPYDLTVVDTADAVAHRFVGLTTHEPRVQPIGGLIGGQAGDLRATISGNLIHGTLVPLPADHDAIVCVEGLSGEVKGCQTSLFAGASSYNVTADWYSIPEVDVRVRAYIFEVNADGVPVTIKASGTAGPTALADSDAAVLDITLTDTAVQANLQITTSVPSGYTLNARSVVTHYTNLASLSLNPGTPQGSTGTHIAPYFPGANLTAYGTATSASGGSTSASLAWSTGHTSGESTTLDLPVPPTVLSPPEGSTNITMSTEYAVANPSGGVITFVLAPDTGESGPTLAVTTAHTSAVMPNVAAFGLALPGNTPYTWVVLASHDVETADAAVTGSGYLGDYINLSIAASGGGFSPEADGRISTTDNINITTQ